MRSSTATHGGAVGEPSDNKIADLNYRKIRDRESGEVYRKDAPYVGKIASVDPAVIRFNRCPAEGKAKT